MVLKLFTTFIVVAAILASPKHRAFTWSYRSSIYRVHWDENKGSRPSLIALQTELLLLYLNGVRRSELVAPNSNSSSSGAD